LKEALRLAAKRLVLDDKVYPDDPIFKSTERASKPGKKNNWSVDHDKILYGKPWSRTPRNTPLRTQAD